MLAGIKIAVFKMKMLEHLSMTLERLSRIDVLSLVLAAIALLFAIKQYLDARKAERDARDLKTTVGLLETKIGVLEGQTSTRAIERFPDNVSAVCKLLDSCTANMNVKIMVDNIGYCLYSDEARFKMYLESLRGAIRRKVNVRLLVYDYSRTKRAIRGQYPSISEERAKDRFASFFKNRGRALPASEREFYSVLIKAEENLYDDELKRVEMKLLTEEPPALFWLKDNPDSMVFSFRDEFPGTGYSFESKDANIAAQFTRMFNKHWESAEDHWNSRW